MSTASHWRLAADQVLNLSTPRIMGILNVTPDSFSDGGRWRDAAQAVDGAIEMLQSGADLIDIGGESTRPGAERISASMQIDRVVPVVNGIRQSTQAPITIDTTLSVVAEAALDAGANAINDVAAGLEDEGMLSLAAKRDCGIVLMHRLQPPELDAYSDAYDKPPLYKDVVEEVLDWLQQRAAAAETAGVKSANICIDPGLGFGKSVAQNWALIAASEQFAATGRPVLSAASRKSFIGGVTGESRAQDRVAGSLAVTAMQFAGGLRLFRVHDVAAQAKALRTLSQLHAEAPCAGQGD